MKSLVKFILALLLKPLRFFVPMGNVVLAQTLSPIRYCENSRYLYEWAAKNSDLRIYWLTKSDAVIAYLKKNQLPYIDQRHVFRTIWATLRAKVVIDSGTHFFNFLNLLHPKCIKFNSSHGCGPKCVINELDKKKLNRFDYYTFPSSYSIDLVAKKTYELSPEKILKMGFPRCDQFFDKKSVDEAYRNKEVVKSLNPHYQRNSKVLLFTPTWRPYDFSFPLNDLVDFLEDNNFTMFCTLHTAKLPAIDLRPNKHLIIVDTDKHPLFDINQLMVETDILINDYSTTSTDFSILKRPQIFYIPDFEHYDQTKGFVEDYLDVLQGPKAKNLEQLKDYVLAYAREPKAYERDYLDKNTAFLAKYYDTRLQSACKDLTQKITSL